MERAEWKIGAVVEESDRTGSNSIMDKRLTSLGAILMDADSYPWNFALFLPKTSLWSEGTLGAVLNPADREDPNDPEDVPGYAKQNDFKYVLMMSDVQDIVANAREQLTQPTGEQLIAAFHYYYKHDAYIDFEKLA